jgi:cysteine desulfurase
MNSVYLDNSATTAMDQRVIDAMLPFFGEKYGNASSLHSFGHEAKVALENGREQVASFLGCRADEVYFTAGGTESDNIALQGVAYKLRSKGNHIITTEIEHPAVLETCEYLAQQGFEITYLPVNNQGLVSPDDLAAAMTEKTILVSVMHANNEIGTIQPIRELANIAHERNALFHTDAVQSAGKVPLDVEYSSVDLLSLSSHKLHGPKGVGALYVRDGTPIQPIIYGGGHERGLRSSTENIPGIVGFGAACELAQTYIDIDIALMTQMRDALIDGIMESVPKVTLNGHPTKRLCNNVNVSFEAVEGEALILSLNRAGIAASTGSACSSKKFRASHVLMAIGLEQTLALGSLRLSLSRMNTMEEIYYTVEKLPPMVARLRAMSPLWKEE